VGEIGGTGRRVTTGTGDTGRDSPVLAALLFHPRCRHFEQCRGGIADLFFHSWPHSSHFHCSRHTVPIASHSTLYSFYTLQASRLSTPFGQAEPLQTAFPSLRLLSDVRTFPGRAASGVAECGCGLMHGASLLMHRWRHVRLTLHHCFFLLFFAFSS
jgi:hypothetical protein